MEALLNCANSKCRKIIKEEIIKSKYTNSIYCSESCLKEDNVYDNPDLFKKEKCACGNDEFYSMLPGIFKVNFQSIAPCRCSKCGKIVQVVVNDFYIKAEG